jgi:16S rRNA (cytidine1402-2'-O)-methyltransferase
MMARNEGFNVTCLPGPSAMPTAVALSGLDAARFRFEGFLPNNKSQRLVLLDEISKDGCAVVIYEAPHRLEKTLNELKHYFKGRRLAIVNDITKLHERVEIYDVDDVTSHLNDWKIKGEFVIVIEKGEKSVDDWWQSLSIQQHILTLMEKENISKMDAVKKVAKQRNIKKNEIYKQSINI